MITIKAKARFNHRILTTSTFDSGALGLLAYVIHQFQEGRYTAVVNRDQKNVGSINFLVESTSDNIQLMIDLATVSTVAEVPKVSPKGYVMFYVSGGEGSYSVVASEESGASLVFDSTKLSDNVLFAVSILEPATYSMVNQAGSATGEIQVTPAGNTDPHTLPTQYVDVSTASFDPTKINLQSSQGLVFRIKGPARIVITKQPGKEFVTSKHEGKKVRRHVRVISLYRSDPQQNIPKQVRRHVRVTRSK